MACENVITVKLAPLGNGKVGEGRNREEGRKTEEGRGRRQTETDGQKDKCGKTHGKRELKGEGEERRWRDRLSEEKEAYCRRSS